MGLKSGSKSGKGVKHGTTKLGMGKSASQSSNKQSDSDDESDIDTSVMKPSIEISVSTVPQLVRAYQAATEELKSILAKECDIIYECRVCRNLFRSLANMMAHKRIYCKTTYSYTKHAFTKNHKMEEYTVLIQPESVSSNPQENWITSDKVPDCTNDITNTKSQIIATTSRISSFTHPKKGLRDIVDRLARNTSDERANNKDMMKTRKLFDKNSNPPSITQIEHSYHLEDIETSKVGMFQTKLASTVDSEKDDLMKAQVSELQFMASQNEATLGPDGKLLNIHSPLSILKNTFGNTSDVNLETAECKSSKDEHICPDCNVKFSTRKTLNHHMKSLHVTFRLCYPCPCCKSTFVNSWSVYRHLYKVHRKTAAQVRRLRPQIQRKAFKKETHNEIPTSESCSKNEALKESQRIDQENQAWMDNFEDDQELQRCGGCGRRFERRAALNSHSQICQKRIAARNNVKVARSISSVSNSDKTTKVSSNDEQSVTCEINRKTNTISKSVDAKSNSLPVLGSKSQVNNWADQPKREIVREKKIEIQIRKDYCKMSSASSVVALSNDTQSEPDSRPPSCIAEDEDCFDGDVREWNSLTEIEQMKKEETESKYHLFRDAHDLESVAFNENGKDNESVYSNSTEEITESVGEFHSTLQNNTLSKYSSKEDNFSSGGKQEKVLKRRSSDECSSHSENTDNEAKKRSRQSIEDESIKDTKIINKNVSSKCKKIEEFYPVMEARMKKLINLRRLQCLPCQKKFIKLTNLRRHVAVHIGWCRYKCMLCPFKCFSKSECVDHVCKIHLKGSHRTKASTMVEYIEEQESTSNLNSVDSEKINIHSDVISTSEDAPEPLSLEINSLDIEDIKNIVGVTCYLEEVNKSESCTDNIDCTDVNNGLAFENPNQTDILSTSDAEENKSKTVLLTSTNNALEESISKNSVDESVKTKSVSLNISEENQNSEILKQVENEDVNDDNSETDQVHSMRKLHNCIDVEGEKSPPSLEHDTVKITGKSFSQNAEKEITVCDEIELDSSSLQECALHYDSALLKPCKIPVSLEETVEKSSFSTCNSKKQDNELEEIKELAEQCIEETIKPCDIEKRNNKMTSPTKFLSQEESKQEKCVQIGETPRPNEISSENRILKNGDIHEIVNDIGNVENHICEEKEKDFLTNLNSSECSSNLQEDENALRKMVMEVIFGSGGTSHSYSDLNKNVSTISVNGNTLDDSSSESSSLRASSPSHTVIIDGNQFSSTSRVLKPNVQIDCVHSAESEKRERPIRNRVKVEKEDFIYDFNESYLKKEEASKSSVTTGANSNNRKKQVDSGKEGLKYDIASSHSGSGYKGVPKLTLVRVDTSETSGNKRVNGPLKGSWSSVYASASACTSNKTYLEENSQISSPKKIPRTHDV